jgi:hypothetical protein
VKISGKSRGKGDGKSSSSKMVRVKVVNQTTPAKIRMIRNVDTV